MHTSSKAVAAASVEVFKARLHGDCSNLGWWKVYLPIAGWNWMVFRVPPKPFCDEKVKNGHRSVRNPLTGSTTHNTISVLSVCQYVCSVRKPAFCLEPINTGIK